MARRVKPARRDLFGILNPYGDIWTTDTFESEEQAQQHVADFWHTTKDIDLSKFKVIRVRVTVSALPALDAEQEPAMTPTREVVARLKPLHMADEPIAQAVVSSDQAERLRAVEAYIRANNALKTDALALISSLVAERAELLNRAEVAEYKQAQAVNEIQPMIIARAETAERLLAEARETLEKLACRHVTEQPLWWQLEARATLSTGGVNG